MNFLKKLFNTVTICCLSMLLMSLSCSKSDDDIVVTPLRDATKQRDSDMEVIDKYLNEYTYTINANNDIDFVLHTTSSSNPKLILLPTSGTTFPQLRFKTVNVDAVDYKIYYLVFNEGNTAKKPVRVDQVLVGYRGIYLENNEDVLGVIKEFENEPIATNLFSLSGVIRGWTEIVPFFGAGIVDSSAPSNDPTAYVNYGVGAMFIPSGLAYFNAPPSGSIIPSYSPLVFTIKLFDVKRDDRDFDKVESRYEMVTEPNGTYVFTDTDGDGTVDLLDNDDDNDGIQTINEVKKPDGTFYNFNDIPGCNGLATDPTRIKRHLVRCQ